MLTKESVIKNLETLPDEFSYDELLDRLHLLYKIENAREQAIKKEVISEVELEERFGEWLK